MKDADGFFFLEKAADCRKFLCAVFNLVIARTLVEEFLHFCKKISIFIVRGDTNHMTRGIRQDN